MIASATLQMRITISSTYIPLCLGEQFECSFRFRYHVPPKLLAFNFQPQCTLNGLSAQISGTPGLVTTITATTVLSCLWSIFIIEDSDVPYLVPCI